MWLINAVNDTAPGLRGIGLWDEHGRVSDAVVGLVTFEAHLDRQAHMNRIRLAVNDIGGYPQSWTLTELDDSNHIWNRHRRIERLAIDRIGEHRAPTRDRPSLDRSAAIGAVLGGPAHPQAAPRAPRNV